MAVTIEHLRPNPPSPKPSSEIRFCASKLIIRDVPAIGSLRSKSAESSIKLSCLNVKDSR